MHGHGVCTDKNAEDVAQDASIPKDPDGDVSSVTLEAKPVALPAVGATMTETNDAEILTTLAHNDANDSKILPTLVDNEDSSAKATAPPTHAAVSAVLSPQMVLQQKEADESSNESNDERSPELSSAKAIAPLTHAAVLAVPSPQLVLHALRTKCTIT
jgi:nitrate reductase NapAB chaperone NapD